MTKPDRLAARVTLNEAAEKMTKIMQAHFRSLRKGQIITLLYKAINGKQKAVKKERARLRRVVRQIKDKMNPMIDGADFSNVYKEACNDILQAMQERP